MDRGKAGLTVFFEGPFWVGVFERVEDGRLSVCRVVFGSEPRDYEVLEFILKIGGQTLRTELLSVATSTTQSLIPLSVQSRAANDSYLSFPII